jgi:hypothetical protein
MSTETILVVILVILVVGALPSWPHSRSWGYGPSGILTVLGVILLAFILFGDGNNRRNDGSLEDAGRQVSRDLGEAGRDIKRSVQDATD